MHVLRPRLLRVARPLAQSRVLCTTTASESEVKVSVTYTHTIHNLHTLSVPRQSASTNLPRPHYPPQTDEHTGELFSGGKKRVCKTKLPEGELSDSNPRTFV
jgi:hypothetical protein